MKMFLRKFLHPNSMTYGRLEKKLDSSNSKRKHDFSAFSFPVHWNNPVPTVPRLSAPYAFSGVYERTWQKAC
jgi:hypothetical protein